MRSIPANRAATRCPKDCPCSILNSATSVFPFNITEIPARTPQMIDLARQRSAIQTQIAELSKEQLKALKKAVFMGWSHEESISYVELRRTIALLLQPALRA